MKKIIVFLILLYGQLYAMDRVSTLELYNHLFSHMSKAKVVAVYVEDKEYQKVFASSKFIRLVPNIKDADFVMVTSDKILAMVKNSKLDKKTILFATKYKYLKESEKIIGAFYWKKRRFQYLFLKNRLEDYNVSLPVDYNEFIRDKL